MKGESISTKRVGARAKCKMENAIFFLEPKITRPRSGDDVFIDVELDNSVHFEKCLDVVPNVVLCAEEEVSRCFRPQPLNVAP